MLEALAGVLWLIMQPCYDLTGNWWVAILLFTVIVKILLMPMSLWCQKNSIVMVKLMPDLNRLKVKYFGDSETIGEKQNELYKQKHYHPMLSLVPLAVQIIILFGLVEVIHDITDYGAPGTEFLGLVPVEDGGISWVMPLLAGLSAVAMGFAQNRINPLQREQSRLEKNTTNGLSIALSFFLGIFVAAGMAFYWICSNLMAIAVQALCNLIMKPAKHIDYEDLAASRVDIDALNALEGERKVKWYKRDPLAKREKADYKRFFSVLNKHIVFYSEGSGFYKYFRGAIEYLLEHSDARIHYVTSDPHDQIFKIAEANPRICPYYIGEKRLITLMMKLEADVVVTTLEDLESFYIKRSYVDKLATYVFMFHHMTSTHLTPHEESYDHYDVLLCVGPHQVAEVRRAEQMRSLPAKELVECGYDLLDREIAAYEELDAPAHAAHAAKGAARKPTVLIAPSWQEDCILDSCIDEMLEGLIGRGNRIIVRPHPEYTKRYRARWEAVQARWAHVAEDELYFERDFSSNEAIFSSDVLVTDWSSVAYEFSFATLHPSVFIDTKMKVGNADWRKLGIEPTDITWRDKVGVSIAPTEVARVGSVVDDMIANGAAWKRQIEHVRAESIFNLGHGAQAAGEYLLDLMLRKQEERKQERDHA